MQRLSAIVTLAAVCAATAVATAGGPIRFVNHLAPPNGDGLSWGTAYRTLSAALADAAADPAVTQIWIAEGTYLPDTPIAGRDATFALVAGVGVYGGFVGDENSPDEREPNAHETVLSGDLDGDDGPGFTNYTDNLRHVVTAAGFDAHATLDGLTIRGGNADFPGEELLGGGGLYVDDAEVEVRMCRFEANSAGQDQPDLGGFGGAAYLRVGSLTIRDSVFADNRATNGGALGDFDGLLEVEDSTFEDNAAAHQVGGVMWAASNTQIVYRRCAFRRNHAQYAGALFTVLAERVDLVECEFRENTAAVEAGACWLQRSDANDTVTAIIDRCSFVANSAGSRGALILEETDTLLTDCVFIGNRGVRPGESGSGAILTMFDDFEAVNCVFSGNSADFCGALQFFRNETARVTNCSFSGNLATILGSGGGIFVELTTVDLTNSVLFGNFAGGARDEFAQVSGSARTNFNDIEGWTGSRGGTGNIGLDPRFADPAGADGVPGTEDDDLRLADGSPAIDAADNDAVPPGITGDLDGAPRFVDDPGTPDTGRGSPPIVDMGAYEFQPVVCVADLDGSGAVDFADLLVILSTWGPCDGECPGDLDGSGAVDFGDLLVVLGAWGPCE